MSLEKTCAPRNVYLWILRHKKTGGTWAAAVGTNHSQPDVVRPAVRVVDGARVRLEQRPLIPDFLARDVAPEVRLDAAAVGDHDGVAQRHVEREPREHADGDRRGVGRDADLLVEGRMEVADKAVE
eukprot:680627-Prymnesium_polylepis.1